VTIRTGAYQPLKSIDWRGPSNAVVSPDGRYLVYDLPVSETSRERDVFVLLLDGTRAEQRASDRQGLHSVVGWSPSGDMVLFATERAGTMVLHGTAVENGMPQGAPRVIEPDLGTFVDTRGITENGRLLFTKKTGGVNVFTSTIDVANGSATATPARITDGVVANFNSVMWSPDGQHLAYVARHRGSLSFVIRSALTGASREITPVIRQIQSPRWTAPSFITFQGSDLRGRQGIFMTDVQTGETTLVVGGDNAGYRSWPDATPDGRRVVYALNNGKIDPMLVRDIETGQERTLTTESGTARRVSPDGRWVAYRIGVPKSQSIMIAPLEGGTPRAVLTVPAELSHFVDWTADSRSVQAIVGRKLVVVDIDGGTRREMDLPEEASVVSIDVHPDGRRVVYSAGPGRDAYELWALDNFLPGPR
jgi:Tol biopolymer transport system component